MKKLMIMMICALAFASCKTPQQLAQRHLKKALRLDPNVIKEYTLDTTIKGIASGIVPVDVPETKGSFGFDCEALKKQLDSAISANRNASLKPNDVLVGQDSNVVVTVGKDKNGNYNLNYKTKPKTIYVPVNVPFEVPVKVPGKQINVEVPAPFWKYYWFWILAAVAVLELYLLVKNTKPIMYIKEKLKRK